MATCFLLLLLFNTNCGLCFINFEQQSHRTVPTDPTAFEERGEPKSQRTEVPLLNSLTAKPNRLNASSLDIIIISIESGVWWVFPNYRTDTDQFSAGCKLGHGSVSFWWNASLQQGCRKSRSNSHSTYCTIRDSQDMTHRKPTWVSYNLSDNAELDATSERGVGELWDGATVENTKSIARAEARHSRSLRIATIMETVYFLVFRKESMLWVTLQ